jgi:hypothetical protein
VIALLRYQAAILLRSHRWLFPLIAYVALIAAGAAEGSTPLSDSLGWSAAMLVPVVAFGTRSMLTAEPDAARACAAAAAGPVRAQVAALLTALGGGIILAVAAAIVDVVTSESVLKSSHPSVAEKITATAAHPSVLLAGLATAVVCLLVASAIGALFNPPLLRHPGVAMLTTLAAAIVAVASDVSPAGAALRHSAATRAAAQWPGVTPAIAALALLAVTWAASALAAARRG